MSLDLFRRTTLAVAILSLLLKSSGAIAQQNSVSNSGHAAARTAAKKSASEAASEKLSQSEICLVAVGYPGKAPNRLNFTSNDITDIEAAFKQLSISHPQKQPTIVALNLDENGNNPSGASCPTNDSLKERIKDALKNCPSTSKPVLYLSGHGEISPEGEYNYVGPSGPMSMDDVVQAYDDACRERNTDGLSIIDTCFAGALASQMNQGLCLAGCAADEKGSEHAYYANGLLTHALTNCMIKGGSLESCLLTAVRDAASISGAINALVKPQLKICPTGVYDIWFHASVSCEYEYFGSPSNPGAESTAIINLRYPVDVDVQAPLSIFWADTVDNPENPIRDINSIKQAIQTSISKLILEQGKERFRHTHGPAVGDSCRIDGDISEIITQGFRNSTISGQP